MDHAVDLLVEADEQPKLGDVLDFALDLGPDREFLQEVGPRIGHTLLQAQTDAPLVAVDIEDHDLHFLACGDDLARVDVLFGPAHLGDVDQAFDAGLQFHESAVVGDVGYPAGQLDLERILGVDALPRVGFKLLHAQ